MRRRADLLAMDDAGRCRSRRRFSPCSDRSNCTSPPGRVDAPRERRARSRRSRELRGGARRSALQRPTAGRSKPSSAICCASAGWTIAVAESCTGGLLASRLTDVPGSSDYVDRGVVCYSNRAKIGAARRSRGPDRRARRRQRAGRAGDGRRDPQRGAHSDVGIGITGIAGPGGGTAEKPVGTVAIAVAATALSACERSVSSADAKWSSFSRRRRR